MAEWVKCKDRNDPPAVVFVNLSSALTVYRRGEGTRIVFVGGEDSFVDVREMPEEVMKLPRIE